MSEAATTRRPTWAVLAAVGVALVALGGLTFLIGPFLLTSPGAILGLVSAAVTVAVLGIVVTAAGLVLRLMQVRR